MIEVEKITEDNIDDIQDITMVHTYDKKTKTLSFRVHKTPGTTSKRSMTNTTNPKYS